MVASAVAARVAVAKARAARVRAVVAAWAMVAVRVVAARARAAVRAAAVAVAVAVAVGVGAARVASVAAAWWVAAAWVRPRVAARAREAAAWARAGAAWAAAGAREGVRAVVARAKVSTAGFLMGNGFASFLTTATAAGAIVFTGTGAFANCFSFLGGAGML